LQLRPNVSHEVDRKRGPCAGRRSHAFYLSAALRGRICIGNPLATPKSRCSQGHGPKLKSCASAVLVELRAFGCACLPINIKFPRFAGHVGNSRCVALRRAAQEAWWAQAQMVTGHVRGASCWACWSIDAMEDPREITVAVVERARTVFARANLDDHRISR